LLVLWYFATRESNRELAVRFGMTDSTVHESVDIVMTALSKRLHHLVKFSISVIEIRAVAYNFHKRNHYPGIVGAIDGSPIRIQKPKDEPDVWIDRKGIHSINLTAVVDALGRFTS